MRLRIAIACSLVAGAAAMAGCDSGASGPRAEARQQGMRSEQARPPAPAAAGALAQIADVPEARRRLAFVNLERLAEVRPAVSPRAVLRHVLGATGAERLTRFPASTAVQVGKATVVRGPELRRPAGAVSSGRDGIVLGGAPELRHALSNPRPETSAITPAAQSAVQSCLGDAAAQTTLGPQTMGRDSAIGAGLRASADKPAGVQLAICFAPHLRRDLRAGLRRLKREFAALRVPRARQPVIEERDIGERDILSAVIPADAVGERRLLALLDGGRSLRALGGRG